MPIETFLIRIGAALGLALLIGIEREWRKKPLGARAYALVAMGTAGMMATTIDFSMSGVGGAEGVKVDPSRLIQGVVGGIGFLGAGAVISSQSEGRLRGVASGAAVWVAGAIGIACGAGMFKQAAAMTALTLAVLLIHDLLDKKTDVTAETAAKD